MTLKPSVPEVTLRVAGKVGARVSFKSFSYCTCVFSICLVNASVIDCVSSAFCFASAPATVLAIDCVSSDFCCASAPASATVMVLASMVSLDSWSQLWSLFSVEEVAASPSLDLSLPIARSESVNVGVS